MSDFHMSSSYTFILDWSAGFTVVPLYNTDSYADAR